jgi:hypothetical protein
LTKSAPARRDRATTGAKRNIAAKGKGDQLVENTQSREMAWFRDAMITVAYDQAW